VNLLLGYLFLTFFVGLRAERRYGSVREVPKWQVLVPAMAVTMGFLSQRLL
jgi:hypothetical protein